MQPITGAPPLPQGAAALSAWRELPRATRRELLRADGPHPDPAAGVVAVGYARAVLARSPLRHAVPLVGVLFAVLLPLIVVLVVTTHSKTISNAVVLPLALAGALAWRIRIRGRLVALHRMESVNSAALWETERGAPIQAAERSAPTTAEEVEIRYNAGALRRQYAFLAVYGLVAVAVLAVLFWYAAVAVAVLMVVVIARTVVVTRRHVRPDLPMLVMDAEGVRIPAMRARLAWADLTEIRVKPFRAWLWGKDRHATVFVLADPEVLSSQLDPWWTRRTQLSTKAHGSPLAVADLSLDHTSEETASAAAALSGLPVRRFGL
ncbi:hypothetical protein J4573_35115 [Actinomadura barringtoniae]|uniref:Uncharacterized protein n=1 Tax=Actinomadura barringtoniae TaxID=1427535 RepID=A0A939PGR5_9ACTN|nr:hypothetical protein [Actinomadura barringtoniae]MBO2452366.1 hypothetical protein [Actinomadura barringtoniae]